MVKAGKLESAFRHAWCSNPIFQLSVLGSPAPRMVSKRRTPRSEIFQVFSFLQTPYFFPRSGPQPRFVWIVRSPASTWGKHFYSRSRNRQYLGESDSPVPLIDSESRQYLGRAWLFSGTASTWGKAIPPGKVLPCFESRQYLGQGILGVVLNAVRSVLFEISCTLKTHAPRS